MRRGDTLDLDLTDRRTVFTVSRLNREARLIVEESLGTVWVEGEISNLSRPSSGHVYWTLKDAHAQLRCAMFRQHGRVTKTELQNGRQVLARGRVSLYEPRGEFQLVVDYVEEAGEGLLRRKFEELKRKLAAEGLFDAARKRPLPKFPSRIGIVTSPTGAALRDVLTVLRRRYPAASVLIYPSAVQGDAAAADLCRTLRLADVREECDLLIVARGGGSLEDLWAFNDETLARTLASLSLPTIVGVGHEIDFTIADFVADLRAPTPSQAAALAVPDQAEWRSRADRLGEALERVLRRRIGERAGALRALAHRLTRCHPGVLLRELGQGLDELEGRLRAALLRSLHQRILRVAKLETIVAAANPRHRLAMLSSRHAGASRRLEGTMRARLERAAARLAVADRALRSLSPTATLERGYAIVCRLDDGRLIVDSAAVDSGTGIRVRLARGALEALVSRSEPPESAS
jgi:exodeoxyribonuclease VII large subunit